MSLRCGLSSRRPARDRARPKVRVEVVQGAASIKGGRRGELERGATLLVLRGKALPEPQYRLLEMWYVDRLSVGEIALALGLATSQVSIHLTYLSKTLRTLGRGRKRAAR
jgi:DNA-directed RNA polymerase specialized sigma24 family protein